MKTRVTLDTNVVSRAMRERSPLRSSIGAGRVQVFVAETSLTLDGLFKNGKIKLLGLNKPRHAFNQSRWDSFVECGVSFLLCPRIALPRPIVRDAHGNKVEYALLHAAPEDKYDQRERQDRYTEALSYIEGTLGAGQEWLKSIEKRILGAGGCYDVNNPWFINVAQNSPVLGEKAIMKGVSDWADADALAAHYAYGNDIFGTDDKASGAGSRSVLSRPHRDKLKGDLGIRIMNLDDLERGNCI